MSTIERLARLWRWRWNKVSAPATDREAVAGVAPIPEAIRAEIDQTPEWWDRQYAASVRKQIPRNPEHHAAHDVHEPIRSWGGVIAPAWCSTCGVPIECENCSPDPKETP